MTYNFTDDPSPELPTTIDPATGAVALDEGSPQGDYLTHAFSGRTVSISILPPSGWTLDDVTWSGGGTGTFTVPVAGQEETHSFTYTVSQNGSSQNDGGVFKIKRAGGAD